MSSTVPFFSEEGGGEYLYNLHVFGHIRIAVCVYLLHGNSILLLHKTEYVNAVVSAYCQRCGLVKELVCFIQLPGTGLKACQFACTLPNACESFSQRLSASLNDSSMSRLHCTLLASVGVDQFHHSLAGSGFARPACHLQDRYKHCNIAAECIYALYIQQYMHTSITMVSC